LGRTKSQSTPQNGIGRELTAIMQLLDVDLNEVTRQQRDAAEIAIRTHPGNWPMILAVKQWARALAGVCRKHARDCAQVHANRNEQDPETSAMGTIVLALSDHLRLPADGTLLFDDWPAENALRDFVLEASGAPVELSDGEIVRKPTLPRWEPKSSFGRKIAGLGPCSQEQGAEFLSVDETQKRLSGLEELFRGALLEGLGTSFSEAVLALPAARINGRHDDGTILVPLWDAGRQLDKEQGPREQFGWPALKELSFKKLSGECIVAVKPYTPIALLNTYNDFAQTLAEVLTVVRKNQSISADDLRQKFAHTALAQAATVQQWEEWIEEFASRQLTAKNAALVLLEDTTGSTRGSLKTTLSKARGN